MARHVNIFAIGQKVLVDIHAAAKDHIVPPNGSMLARAGTYVTIKSRIKSFCEGEPYIEYRIVEDVWYWSDDMFTSNSAWAQKGD